MSVRSEPAFGGSSFCVWFDVHADAEHDRSVARFGEAAGDLASAKHHVVRPLDLDRQTGSSLERVGDSDARDEGELGQRCARLGASGAASRASPFPAARPTSARAGRAPPSGDRRRRGRLRAGTCRRGSASTRRTRRRAAARRASQSPPAASVSTRTALTLYSGVPMSGSPTSCVSQFTFCSAKWSAIQTSPG